MKGCVLLNTYKHYFKILEELRLSKRVTVENLCDGIISERTYYRYLASEQDIKLDVIDKLAKKLNVSTQDIIHHAYFVRQEDPGITRFIYRVHVSHHNDIEPLYQKVKTLSLESESFQKALDVHVHKYTYQTSRIRKETYLETLKTHALSLEQYAHHDINAALTLSLFVKDHPEGKQVNVLKIYDYLIEKGMTTEPLFVIFTIDNLLDAAINHGVQDFELFKQLTQTLGNILQGFAHKFFSTQYRLYQSYIHHREQNIPSRDLFLYKHIIGIAILHGGDAYKNALKRIKDLFDVDAMAFARKMTKEILS